MSEYVQEHLGKLYIYYLKLEDSGEYECQAEDGSREKVYLRVYDGDQPPAPGPGPQPEPEQPGDECVWLNNLKSKLLSFKIKIVFNNTINFEDKYAIRAYVEQPVIRFKNGQNVEQICTGMTNGNNLEIEWYNQRQQVRFF